MTICIAVLCESGEAAILVADRRIGMEFVEADTALKMGWLLPDWRILLAGNDFSAAAEISRRASALLSGPQEKRLPTPDIIVRDALVSSYERVRLARAESEYLKSRGWSLEEFKQKGRASLPESTFSEIDNAIHKYDLEVDLIACGFPSNYGSIIAVTNPGVASFEADSGFAAIGTGSVAAISSLYARGFTRHATWPKALYYVYEAKVAAERASGVGEFTDLIILRQGKEFSIDEHGALRSIWERLKPRNLSETDLRTIEAIPQRELGRNDTPKSKDE